MKYPGMEYFIDKLGIMAEKKINWSSDPEMSASEIFKPRKSIPRSPTRTNPPDTAMFAPPTQSSRPVSEPITDGKRRRDSPEEEEIRKERTVEETESISKIVGEFQATMTELNTIVLQEKISTTMKQILHESFGKLQTLFQKIVMENENLRGQIKVLSSSISTPSISYAQAVFRPTMVRATNP